MFGKPMRCSGFIRVAGFTLIELLIVVAIIAILAAIALPNMLEAQTRAKVSRVQADIRTLAVGVEMFRLDTGRYPPHNDTPADLAAVTTPVAYLTSLPFDPFESTKNFAYPSVGPYYTWQDLHDICYRLGKPDWGGNYWAFRQVAAGRVWTLSSPGPDMTETMGFDATAIYDPTNGTISVGDIYRMGP